MDDMTDHNSTDVDDLRALLGSLSDRLTDNFLRGETLRALLVEHGIFSQAEFDAELQERQKLWSNRIYYLCAPRREAVKIARYRQQLTAFKPAQT
jgi:hypothetical protein